MPQKLCSHLLYQTFSKSGGIHLREKAIKTGGGITVYMKEGITYLHLNDLECDEHVAPKQGNYDIRGSQMQLSWQQEQCID